MLTWISIKFMTVVVPGKRRLIGDKEYIEDVFLILNSLSG